LQETIAKHFAEPPLCPEALKSTARIEITYSGESALRIGRTCSGPRPGAFYDSGATTEPEPEGSGERDNRTADKG